MNKNRLAIPFLLIFIAGSFNLGISSCATSSVSNAASNSDSNSSEQKTGLSELPSVEASSNETMVAPVETAQKKSPAPMDKPIQIVEECKRQPYVQYEKQAREHIQHGWEATQAQRFGVGFRDADEYEKWRATHTALFSKVAETCAQLSQCTKQNPEKKDQQCAALAARFDQWQNLAKRFLDKVKIVESSQPPVLCSLTPSEQDPSQCFNSWADQIRQSCQTQACEDVGNCFRAVYFLDEAINQATLACKFVGQELSNCRGYIEETQRRKAKLDQCLGQYSQLPVEILPVL